MPPRNTADAEREYLDALAFYAARDVARAVAFETAYFAARNALRTDPDRFPLHHDAAGPQNRFVRIAGFPYYLLVRTADPADTVILAVLHTAAGPAQLRRAEMRG